MHLYCTKLFATAARLAVSSDCTRSDESMFSSVSQLMLIIGLAHALVVFRVVAAPLMYRGKWTFIKDHARTAAVTLGAVLHYFTIQIMTRVCVSLSFTFCMVCCVLLWCHT